MEVYSPTMAIAVRAHLQTASASELRALGPYYRQRGGPGLALLRTEYLRRGWPDPVPTPKHPEAATCLLTTN